MSDNEKYCECHAPMVSIEDPLGNCISCELPLDEDRMANVEEEYEVHKSNFTSYLESLDISEEEQSMLRGMAAAMIWSSIAVVTVGMREATRENRRTKPKGKIRAKTKGKIRIGDFVNDNTGKIKSARVVEVFNNWRDLRSQQNEEDGLVKTVLNHIESTLDKKLLKGVWYTVSMGGGDGAGGDKNWIPESVLEIDTNKLN